jgi:magnesium transporter
MAQDEDRTTPEPPRDAAAAAPPHAADEPLTPAGVRRLLKAGRAADLLDALGRMDAAPRNDLFVRLPAADQKAVLEAASPALAAALLDGCDRAILARPLSEIDPAALAFALQLVPPESLAEIVLRLPPEAARRLLDTLEPSLRDRVRARTRFDPGTAGGFMSTRCLSVPEVLSVGRALELLRKEDPTEAPAYIYVVDAGGRLVGTAPVRRLLFADARQVVGSVAIRDVVRLRASEPADEVIRLFNRFHFLALPVTDDEGRLLGIVTSDDVMGAVQRAGHGVVHGMTGADPREALTATLAAARGRLPWITVTILGGLACALIGARFEAVLKEFVVLGLFLPVVLALGESVAAQTISVALSGFAAGDVARGRLAAFVGKEVLIGLAVGIYAGAATGLASMAWHGEGRIGLVIGGAACLSVAWAAFVGVVIPAVLHRLRVDPAFAGGPVALALADLSTMTFYLGGAAAGLAAGG